MIPIAASPPADTGEEFAGIRKSIEAGAFDRAADACAVLATRVPASADALALMGEIDYKRGRAADAEAWLDKALAADRRHAMANWLLGNIQQDQGRLDRAISSFRRALRASPGLAEVHNDLGTVYQAKGWYAEAEQCYRQALQFAPGHQIALENLGTALRAQGKLREARQAFVALFKLRVRSWWRKLRRLPADEAPPGPSPGIQDAAADLVAQAQDLQARGDRTGAARLYEQAIALRPASPALHVARGLLHHEAREFRDALECFSTALALDPGHAPALSNLGMVLQDLGHLQEAEETYRLSIESDPDKALSHANRSCVLLALGKIDEAEAAAMQALALSPDSFHGALRLGQVRKEQGRADEAEALFRRALEIEPGNGVALHVLGELYHVMRGDPDTALALLAQSLAAVPGNAFARITHAHILLYLQRFAEGWEEYEWRKRQPLRARVYKRFPYPEWDGSPLGGRTILVNGEQGLGDEIMFAACLADLRRDGARCVVYCDHRLEKLFRRSFEGFEVHGGSHLSAERGFPQVEGIDVQVAAGSLPRQFRRSTDAFPSHRGYLRADPERIAHWKRRLAELGGGLAVGLSWKGGTPLTGATRRTMSLEDLEPLLRTPGVNWISLQFGDGSAELDAFVQRSGIRIRHWQDAIDDIDETAALLCALDARIGVCNTQVHLAGALGLEVWVLAPRVPDWRYGGEGERMLWYPSARMLRQAGPGAWSGPVEQARRLLASRLRAS